MNEFMNKVRAERDVLTIINNRCGQPELCGLTGFAIDLWSRKNRTLDEPAFEELRTVASLIGTVSQRSGERFDERHSDMSQEIGQRIANLARTVDKVALTKGTSAAE